MAARRFRARAPTAERRSSRSESSTNALPGRGRETASRLIPLLIAAGAAAAIGCGAPNASAPRGNAPTGADGGRAKDVRQSHATLWATGDSAGGANAAAVAQLIRRNRPDEVLYLGDIYNGDRGFQAYRRLYGSLPVARTPGNHDWPTYWPRNKPEWYSFVAAGWRVIELNSETGRPAAQLSFLGALLRARGTCRIAFWHRPRYSAGLHGDNPDMDPYWRALQGHARMVISGHDHDLQRFTAKRGLIQLVAGAGGQSHYPVNRRKPGLAFADAVHWGALRIDLQRGSARIAFETTSGRVLDSQEVRCSA